MADQPMSFQMPEPTTIPRKYWFMPVKFCGVPPKARMILLTVPVFRLKSMYTSPPTTDQEMKCGR